MTDARTDGPQNERELEDYLASRHPVSARYREAARETPPPELDAAVLAAARAGVAAAPRRRARWRVPLAAAATMVLGVGLVSQLRDEAVPVLNEDRATTAQKARENATVEALATVDQAARGMAAEAQPPPVAAQAAQPPAREARKAEEAESAKRAAPPAASVLQRQGTVQGEVAAPAASDAQSAFAARERAAPVAPAAPEARAFALAPPVPLSDSVPQAVTLERRVGATRELLALLQAQDAERLSRHLDARLPATAAEAAMAHFASAHAARLLDRQDGGWRVGVQDAAGRDLGTIRLRIIPAGWQILALSPAS